MMFSVILITKLIYYFVKIQNSSGCYQINIIDAS